MKQTIRFGLFETNSSSVHTMTICTAEEYSKWRSGEFLWNGGSFYTKEEAFEDIKRWNNKLQDKTIEDISEDELHDLFIDDGYYTEYDYDDFIDYNFEGFYEEYTSPSGDNIIVFGYSGYDG